MLYTALTKKALARACSVHQGQTDRFGMPVVAHLIHLAERMTDEDTVVVALLHETLERGVLTLSDLRREGFSEKIVDAVNVITYRGERQYVRFIRRLKENRIAAVVKAADLRHDTDITRMDVISDQETALLQKYERALRILSRK
jgi:(p)ppGpp synthase/HD superfamily hydrolase